MRKKSMYDNPFFRDEPFYRAGMTEMEYEEEQNYLNENIDKFICGGYKPLWKQKIAQKPAKNDNFFG